MSKKMIKPEKSWFVKVPARLADIIQKSVKVPARLTDVIQKSGLAGTNDLSAPACDGSELTPKTAQNELPTGEPTGKPTGEPTGEPTGKPTGKPTGSTPIISTRVGDKENMRVGDKENKRFNPSKEENRTLLGETEAGLLSFSDKKIDLETDKGGTFEEYVNGLKLESKEVESLFDFAGDEAEYLRANFDKFKLKLINRSKLLGKDKELDDLSHYRKNLYVFNLLRKPAFRNELIDDIKRSQTFKIQTEFRHHRKGYKWDLFNKDGDRMSRGRIIPRDAPLVVVCRPLRGLNRGVMPFPTAGAVGYYVPPTSWALGFCDCGTVRATARVCKKIAPWFGAIRCMD